MGIERKMKLAVVDMAFNWPPRGGATVDIKETASRLTGHGYDVKLFVPAVTRKGRTITYWGDRNQRIDADALQFDIETIPVPLRYYNPLIFVPKLKNSIEKFNPDRVLIGDSYLIKPFLAWGLREFQYTLRFYSYETLCFNYNQGLPRRKIPKRCHTTSLQSPLRCAYCLWRDVMMQDYKDLFRFEFLVSGAFLPGYRRLFIKTLRSAKSIIVYNELIKNMLQPYNDNIFIIPSGVDPERFKPVEPDSSPDHSKEDKVTILMSGRIDDAAKGGPILIEACRKLRRNRNDFRLLLTSNFEFQEDFIETTGWVNQEELIGILQKADIAAAPSVWNEALGISVIEAMSCGVPVVASELAGHCITVIDNVTGLFFKPGDAGDLAEKLDMLIDDPQLRTDLGKAARKRAVNEFAWEKIIKRHYIEGVFKN